MPALGHVTCDWQLHIFPAQSQRKVYQNRPSPKQIITDFSLGTGTPDVINLSRKTSARSVGIFLTHFCLSEIDHFGKAELQLCNTVTSLDCQMICVVACGARCAVTAGRGSLVAGRGEGTGGERAREMPRVPRSAELHKPPWSSVSSIRLYKGGCGVMFSWIDYSYIVKLIWRWSLFGCYTPTGGVEGYFGK